MSAGHEFTQAVVLGAGLGTRLRPMTEHLPKPGVPLAHVPVAAHTIAHLVAAGVDAVAVNTHYLAEALEGALPRHVPNGLTLRFSREAQLLGTGGGIRAAWALLDPEKPLLVMNGDILFRPDLRRAMAMHQERGALATMIVREHPEAHRLGASEALLANTIGILSEGTGSNVFLEVDGALCTPSRLRALLRHPWQRHTCAVAARPWHHWRNLCADYPSAGPLVSGHCA